MKNTIKKFINLLFEQDNSVIRAAVVAIIMSLSIFTLVWPFFEEIITGEDTYTIFKTPEKKAQETFKNKLEDLKRYAANQYSMELSNKKISRNSIRCYSIQKLIDSGIAPKKEFLNYKGSAEINCLQKKCTYRLWLSDDKHGINDMNYDEINILKFEKGITANENCGK